jgi:hypothetical protein
MSFDGFNPEYPVNPVKKVSLQFKELPNGQPGL